MFTVRGLQMRITCCACVSADYKGLAFHVYEHEIMTEKHRYNV